MAMCAQQLVDGMNLDKSWCLHHLGTRRSKQIEFIWRLVESKELRISQFEPDNITCYVVTEEKAQALRMIPGYNETAGPAKIS